MKKRTWIILMGLSFALLAGCSSTPKTYTSPMDSWSAPLEGYSRIVFYSQPVSVVASGNDDMTTRTYEANISLTSEDFTGRMNIDEGSAEYIDVPPGDYKIDVRLAANAFELSVEAGKTYFVKTQIRSLGFCDDPQLSDEDEAKQIIRSKRLSNTIPELPITLIPRQGKLLSPASFNASDAPAPGRCRLVLLRKSGIVGLIMPVHVGLDCPPHVKVSNKQYCVIDAPAGEHLLTLSYSSNLSQGLSDTYRVAFKLNLPADDSFYVGFFNVDNLGQIRQLPNYEAEELMTKSSPAKDGILKVLPPDEEKPDDN